MIPLRTLIDGFGNQPALTLVNGSPDTPIADLTDDSRQVRPGSLFIARSGATADGKTYIEDAINRGAAAIVCDGSAAQVSGARGSGGVAWVTTPPGVNVDQAFCGRLAERFFDFPSKKLSVIGVTGTNGKTTITFVVRHLLAHTGVKCGVIGTVVIDDGRNARPANLTTPSAIDLSRWMADMVRHGCTAVVMELSSHGLHQGRCAAIDVDVAVFTNLTGDHLDYHKTMDAYADAKAILFEQLRPDAWAVINADDPYASRMVRNCRAKVLHCTLSEPRRVAADADEADAPLHTSATILHTAPDHSRARFDGPWGSVDVRLPLVGRHNVMNVLEAVAAANCVTSIARTLRASLADCPAPPGRLEPVRADDSGVKGPTVLVDYAHTADALENVLQALRPLVQGGKLIVLFGCGGDRDRTKRPKMAAIACRLADRVVITSDNPRTEDPRAIIDEILTGVPPESKPNVTVEPDRAKAIRDTILSASAGDTVLLAGKGHEDYQIIGTQKFPFDDRQHAAEALREWKPAGRGNTTPAPSPEEGRGAGTSPQPIPGAPSGGGRR